MTRLVAPAEHLARTRPGCFAVLATAVLYATAFCVFTPGYLTNDDPMMAMIVSGTGMCLAPDEHLIFTNVLIGQALQALYRTWPAVAWYGLYMLLAQALSQAALLYCALARGYSRWRITLFLLWFSTVGIFYLNNLQFTLTAFIAVQAGVLLCLSAIGQSAAAARRPPLAPLAWGIALVALGSMIRTECFYMTVVVALPAGLCQALLPWQRRALAPLAASAGVCLALVWGLAAYNDAYYARDPRWAAFLEYNKLRIKFNDYEWTRYSPDTAAAFARAGWSENDHAMIAHWFYDDPRYSRENLQKVLSAYPWRRARLTGEYFWKSAVAVLRDKSLWPMLLALPLCMWGMERTWRHRGAVAGTALASMGLIVAIALVLKAPPSRVFFPVLTFPFALSLLLSAEHFTLPRRRWPTLALRCLVGPRCWGRSATRALLRPTFVHAVMTLAIVGAVMAGHRQYRRSCRLMALRSDVATCLAALDIRDDRLYVAWATDFPFEALSPWQSMAALGPWRLWIVSWPQTTPFAEAMKARFALDSVPQALAHRPDVYLLGTSEAHPLCARFVREHYGHEVQFQPSRAGERPFDLAGRLARVPAGAASPPGPGALRR